MYRENPIFNIFWVTYLIVVIPIGMVLLYVWLSNNRYKKLEKEILDELNFGSWEIIPIYDEKKLLKVQEHLIVMMN